MKSVFKPNTLEECVRSDEVSARLYQWATYTLWTGVILCIISIISGFVKANDLHGMFEGVAVTAGFVGGIVALGTGVSECLLLQALASIVESNCIQARAALYTAFADKVNESEIPKELRF